MNLGLSRIGSFQTALRPCEGSRAVAARRGREPGGSAGRLEGGFWRGEMEVEPGEEAAWRGDFGSKANLS
jgi:hypothetical protein